MDLTNLHNGKVYKFIYPSIDADVHIFNSSLQSRWLIEENWSDIKYKDWFSSISSILYILTLPLSFPIKIYSWLLFIAIDNIGESSVNGIISFFVIFGSVETNNIFPS